MDNTAITDEIINSTEKAIVPYINNLIEYYFNSINNLMENIKKKAAMHIMATNRFNDSVVSSLKWCEETYSDIVSEQEEFKSSKPSFAETLNQTKYLLSKKEEFRRQLDIISNSKEEKGDDKFEW